LRQFLTKRINQEGYDKEREPIKIVKVLTEVERLCQINNVQIPDEVFKTTERILEFLMYCSNPDGTVSEFIDKSKENIREWLYWGSRIYKRSDFRYVAFGGLLMENSFPPEKTSVAYPECGIYVMRNGWDIRDRSKKIVLSVNEMLEERCTNLVYQGNKLVISGNSGELAEINFEDCDKVNNWVNDGTKDYLKIGKNEIIFIKPNYIVLKPSKKVTVKGKNIFQDVGKLKTRNNSENIRYKGLRPLRGEELLEIFRLDDEVVINKTESGYELIGGDLFIYLYSDDFRKRQKEEITMKDLKERRNLSKANKIALNRMKRGKKFYGEEQNYEPKLEVRREGEKISIKSLEEEGTLAISYNNNGILDIKNDIQKRNWIKDKASKRKQ